MFTIIGVFTMEVLAIGEALIDLLSNECINENTSNQSFSFNQFAGGAPANVAVAVAKLGGKSALLGKVGDDKFGHFLINALKSHNVNTDHLGLSLRGKTAIAFVSLDKSGERTFEFYDKSAAHYDLHITDLDPTLFTQPKIVSFCSGSLAKPLIYDTTVYAMQQFNKVDSISCMDINFRPAFWDAPHTAASVIFEVAKTVNIIKASKEELTMLYGIEHIESTIKAWIDSGVTLVLMSDGAKPISFTSQSFSGTYPCPYANVVDTTAAGDSFIGGFLYQLAKQICNRSEFSTWTNNFENVLKAIDFATKCGALTVSKFGAFDALPTQSEIANLKLKSAAVA
ncbi:MULTISPECIES: carbohydrate kinase [unclassified Pseudoalteromonas]|jgi:fructokinase|uniref:carbohydrate kinase family protein n=1 Tax=unclassified Pseudoalteromonas TaxID=194690 RepID=UPI0023585630|nr:MULTISPECIES: carbohydrate kinase [unclassified Pseudoalteromonas]MDC9501759.1 carbohydrate kinase [Pseudoalteromonas sp. Angola-18]MDC9531689.1 carbohydrate kinase [Pseudoalteromonas sp. Angola-7]